MLTTSREGGSPSPLTARTTRAASTALVELTGELTRESGQTLIRAVRTALHNGCRDVRIDLRDVLFIDARGLTVCVVAVRMASEADCVLSFQNARPVVARVFALGGLTDELLVPGWPDGPDR